MNELPPDRRQPDDLDDLYRRASDLDPSRPSESVRRAVLQHAAQVALQNRSRQAAQRRSWRRPAAFGALAAAALAGLLIVPRFLTEPASLTARAPAPRPQVRDAPPATAAPAASPTASKTASAPLLAAAQAPAAAAGRLAEPNHQIAGGASIDALSNDNGNAGSGATGSATGSAASDAAVEAGGAATARAHSMPGASNMSEALRQAAQTGDLERLQALLDQRDEIDARDADGRTALMLAAMHGQIRAVEALLAHGADPNAADAHGTTPLQAAVAANQPAIAAALRAALRQPRGTRPAD